MKLILLMTGLALAASCCIDDQEWEDYKKKYHKHYDWIEDKLRCALWKMRKGDINTHNQGGSSYKMGINYFTDLYESEMKKYLSVPLKETYPNGTPFKKSPGDKVPDSINWVEKGAVTKVKDQKDCDASYAFSAAGALEGLMFRANQTVEDLSAQELVDCDMGNYGCRGGWPQQSFEYVKERYGIDTDASYPYVAKGGACQADKKSNATTCAGFLHIESEESLKEAVGLRGPASIVFSANVPNFFMYASGIFDDVCGNHQNHPMLVVGYDRDDVLGKDYWLVKNSWSDDWGEKGYVKILKNVNLCQVGEKASIPVIRKP